MKKNRVNAFTLVEMLIVIVIIGILIAALMPRMQAAQWRARDVSRKTALSQVQSAIVTSQWDKWEWPWQCEDVVDGCAQMWTGLDAISKALTTAWMNSVPVDPLRSQVWWLWKNLWDAENGNYSYMVAKRNWTPDWWFVLMAKTEVEWWSNWVVCSEEPTACSDSDFNIEGKNNKWCLPGNNLTDITQVHPCTKFEKKEDGTAEDCYIDEATNTCHYVSDGQLRYILVY